MLPRFLTTLFLLCTLALPARAEMTFEPVTHPLAGPQAARGAIIYNHGKAHLGDPNINPPPYLGALSKDGWDVFRLVRPWADDRDESQSAARLAQEAKALRAKGYAKVVTIGQSFGGWISVLAAAEPGLFDALVATAPAAHGTWRENSIRYQQNAEIVSMVDNMAPIPALFFFFAGDEYDPGGRAQAIAKILATRNVPYAVVDQPVGFSGHATAKTTGFSRSFSGCIVSFLRFEAKSGPMECLHHKPDQNELSTDFSLPRITTEAGAASSFLGTWYGNYHEGRELVLRVEKTDGQGLAEGTYAFGPSQKNDGGSYPFTGRIEGNRLQFEHNGASVAFTLEKDGQVDARWSKGDSPPLTAKLTLVVPNSP